MPFAVRARFSLRPRLGFGTCLNRPAFVLFAHMNSRARAGQQRSLRFFTQFQTGNFASISSGISRLE